IYQGAFHAVGGVVGDEQGVPGRVNAGRPREHRGQRVTVSAEDQLSLLVADQHGGLVSVADDSQRQPVGQAARRVEQQRARVAEALEDQRRSGEQRETAGGRARTCPAACGEGGEGEDGGAAAHLALTMSRTVLGYGASSLTRRSSSESAPGTRAAPARSVSRTIQRTVSPRSQVGFQIR